MWFFYSLLAALLWGFDYAFAERVFKQISIPFFLVLQLSFAALIMIVVTWSTGTWQKDIASLSSSRETRLLLIFGILAFTAANVLICTAIRDKDATLSGIVEISYPFFIALISWGLFRENQLTLSAFVGGTLIFGGIFIIYYFNH